jgi:predicted phosphohydrolase
VKLIWVTDPHLNLLHPNAARLFGEELQGHGEALLLTGDIAEHPTLEACLTGLSGGFQGPIYYVLGNHDFYKGSFAETTKLARRLHRNNRHWLRIETIELTPSTVLLGSEGWYDCRLGDPSRLDMSDFTAIEDFRGQHRGEIIRLSQREADALAQEAEIRLRAVAEKYRKVIFAMHVPPFPDPAKRDMFWDPWFVHVSMGNILADVAQDYPDTLFTVLCGHKHHPYRYQHSHNLVMFCGEAEYFNPNIAQIITVT